MKKFLSLAFILGTALIFVACSPSEKKEGDKAAQLNVVTTFYPMYDFATKVTKDKADVSMLIDGGVEPHDYEPSAKDMAKIQNADVFIYNSHEMETWVKSVLKNIDTSKTKVIEASEGIELLEGSHGEEEESDNHEGHSHAVDPHVWLDPVLVKQEVDTITKEIAKVDKNNESFYQQNAVEFKKELDKLDQDFAKSFKDATNRKFVTQHMAFSYLAHRYNLEQQPISGISPDQEPTPKELKKIEDFVKNENIKTIYTESSASPKIAKTVSDATGAELAVLNPMETVSKSNRDAGEDYLSIMNQNLQALKLSIK